MIIDSSALVSVIRREEDHQVFFDTITKADTAFLSAATLAETSIVLLGRTQRVDLYWELDALIAQNAIAVEPVTAEDARTARDAFRAYGKGRHPASLNFGDCFTYALARRLWQPILCKGNDFALTDASIVALA
ncbi:Ribonuclease VapC36 [Alphaproteobacteria bacterium SO-S41]|nr:Ribonuclease VapC36 [Alphaproteobacteria bacterium SO-S41]